MLCQLQSYQLEATPQVRFGQKATIRDRKNKLTYFQHHVICQWVTHAGKHIPFFNFLI